MVCPSVTRQPTLACRRSPCASTTKGKPPPTMLLSQRMSAGAEGAPARASNGLTCMTQTGTTRPSGMNSVLGTMSCGAKAPLAPPKPLASTQSRTRTSTHGQEVSRTPEFSKVRGSLWDAALLFPPRIR